MLKTIQKYSGFIYLGMVLMALVQSLHSVDPNIVSFEFAGFSANSNDILSKWGADGTAIAQKGIYFDFGFLIFYSISFFLLCLWAQKQLWEKSIAFKIGTIIAYAQLVAGLSDSIENIGMLIKIQTGSDSLMLVSAICASIKFSFLLIGALYIVFGLLSKLLHRQQ